MNNLEIFKNEELDLQVRAVMNPDGSISISAEDAAIGFGWCQDKGGKSYVRWETLNGYCSDLGFSQEVGKDDYIPESLFYMLGMKASNDRAQKYQRWLAMDVLPAIRKTGAYGMEGLSKELQAVIVVDKRVTEINNRIDKLENDMPLYSYEAEIVSDHAKRRALKVLGGRDAGAYGDRSISAKVFADIYRQMKREFIGPVDGKISYKAIKRKYLADVHDFIDCYEPPVSLRELIDDASAQARIAG